jgi:hypothetical protein
MNVYKELEEVGYSQVKLKNMTDNILDAYKKNPKECERLLKELNNINKELDELEVEFSKFI